MKKNKFFRANLKALARRDRVLARMVQDAGPLPGAVRHATRSGGETITALDPTGEAVLLASKYDPQREAERIVSGMLFEVAETLVIKGMGLGYHLLEMKRRVKPDHFVLVLEPDPRMVFEAFLTHDLSPVILDPHFDFNIGLDLGLLFHKFSTIYRAFFAAHALMVEHSPSLRLNRPYFDEAADQIKRAQTFTIVDLSTQMEHGRLFQANAVANIEAVALAHPISPLKDVYRGVPGFCVAAGPSLGKNLQQLAGLHDRCVIASVDTALWPLVGAGVQPDVVVAIDPHPVSVKLTGGRDLGDLCLFFDQEVCPQVPASFVGPHLACDIGANLPRWTQQVIGCKGEIPKGVTVAHTTFFLLRYMGCDPIVFLGLDLAFPSGRTHVQGSAKTWGGSVKQYLHETGVMTREIDDIFGHKVKTLTNFESFQTRFEVEVAATPQRVIDATEGGARIRGTDVMKLREVIARFLPRNAPKKTTFSSLLEPVGDVVAPGRIARAIRGLLGQLAELGGLYRDALSGLEQLEGADPSPLPPVTSEVQALIGQILDRPETMQLLEFDMTRAYIDFMVEPGSLPVITADPERLVREATRMHRFLSSARDAVGLLSGDLERALERLASPAVVAAGESR